MLMGFVKLACVLPYLLFIWCIEMDKLEEIMAHKREEIAHLIRPVHQSELTRFAKLVAQRANFAKALKRSDGLAVIAEIKRKSPSAGQIADIASAPDQARLYVNAQVDCMSVLTDNKFFGGNLRDLWEVSDFLTDHKRNIPCLRKDFMIHPIQVLEALEAGASCILIIVRALSDDEIKALRDAAKTAKLDILYEVHTEAELERALEFSPKIIGVNNRDLTRFVTDLAFSEKLIPQIPDDIIAVSESGIFNEDDALRARQAGADAILVGEALMKAEDTEQMVEVFHSIDSYANAV